MTSPNLDPLAQADTLPDEEAAVVLDRRTRILDVLYRRTFVELGFICREMQVRALWRHLGYESFNAWVDAAAPYSRSYCFEAKRIVGELKDVPREQLLGMSRESILTLRSLSTAVRNLPDVLEAAKRGDEVLTKKIEAEHPGQHLESRTPMRLSPGRSERKVIEAWVNFAIAHDLASSLTDAVVKACARCLLDEELDELHPVPDEVTV